MGLQAATGQPRKRSVWAFLIAALGLAGSGAIAIPVVAEISSNGETTWGVYGRDPSTETDAIDSEVWAIEQIGNTIYVGGKFLEARPSSTGAPEAQPYLAAFDAGTGDFITSFRPQLESAVYALQASPDGSRLFVGGEFRSVDGDGEAHGLTALDPTTGAVDPTWRAKVSNASGARPVVYSLTVDGGHLYASGRFDRLGSGNQIIHSSEKVGRVSLTDGAVDTTLTTDIDGGSVWGIAVAPDGSKIYLAGHHDSVDGDSAGADYAVLDSGGTLIPSFSDFGGNSGNSNRWYGQDVVAVGDLVFWGGSEHIVRVYSASTGALIREHTTNIGGDYQDLEVVGDRVYGSCHCYTNHYADFDIWGNWNNVPGSVVVTPIKYVAAYSALTGEYLPTFVLDASATSSGVWAIHGAADGCLWIGGDVSRITTVAGNDRATGGFARFCEGNGGDSLAPDTPPNLVQTRSENTKIVIRWDRSDDNLGVDHYEVSRDGVVVTAIAGTGVAQYWYTDANLAIATVYEYAVVAVDAAGNRSAPALLSAATVGAAVGPDVEAPSQPGALTQTWAEDHKVVVRWDASTDDVGVDHYEISLDGNVVATKTATAAATYWSTTTGLAAGTTYQAGVVALDEAGNRSVAAELFVSTTGTPPNANDVEDPTEPANLIQTRSESAKIVLRWDASTDNIEVDHYEVSRDGVVTGTKSATSATTYWFTDTGLIAATNYTYEVTAVDASGNRSTAASITAGTVGAPSPDGPDAPTGLRSTLQTKERIVLNWDPSLGATSYVIWRDDGAGFVEVGTGTGVWFTDQSVTAGTTYAYQVVAVDGAGQLSEPSEALTVATLP